VGPWAVGDKRVVGLLLLVTFVLLAAVFVPVLGRTINGARRWIKLGGLTFQPAELMKFTLVVYLSSYISSRGERLRSSGRDSCRCCS